MDEHILQADLAAIEAECIGWLALGDETYLHVGGLDAPVIEVARAPEAGMAGTSLTF